MPKSVAQLLSLCFAENEAERPHTMLDVAGQLIAIYEKLLRTAYPRIHEKGASDNADALNNRALSYLDLGDQKNAEALWEKALKLDVHHLGAIYNRGLFLWRANRSSDEDLIKQMADIEFTNNSSWQYYYLYGWVCIECSDADRAVAMLEKAAELSADNADISAALETARANKGKWCRHLDTYRAHKGGWTNAVDISSDGRLILSGGSDWTLKIWDTTSGECIYSFKDNEDISAAVLTADKRFYTIRKSQHCKRIHQASR